MAFSDKIQDELDARLQAAFFAMKKRGKAGATAKEIAAEVLGVERADICQIRQFGMTIKAMQLRNMAYALPKEREKAATRWIAIEKKPVAACRGRSPERENGSGSRAERVVYQSEEKGYRAA